MVMLSKLQNVFQKILKSSKVYNVAQAYLYTQ